jgi:hypothetical protein
MHQDCRQTGMMVVVKGLEFFVLSLVDVTQRQAYPLAVQQTVRSAAEKAAIKGNYSQG